MRRRILAAAAAFVLAVGVLPAVTATEAQAATVYKGSVSNSPLKGRGKTYCTGTPAIVDPLAGTWRYTWEAGELVAGTWAVEVQVTYSGGGVQTFPADRPAYFSVRAQLA